MVTQSGRPVAVLGPVGGHRAPASRSWSPTDWWWRPGCARRTRPPDRERLPVDARSDVELAEGPLMLAVDTSALVKRYVDEPGSDEVTVAHGRRPAVVRVGAGALRGHHPPGPPGHQPPSGRPPHPPLPRRLGRVPRRARRRTVPARGRPRSAPTSGSGSSTPSTWPPPPVYRRRCATSRSTRGRCWPPWPSTSNRCPLPRTAERRAQAGAQGLGAMISRTTA